jgi:deazaflavin-dependent oxidoreductase (nitroreductase family)
MADWQWFGRLHRRVYLATGGRLGGNLAGRHMLILTTTGRRSGEARSTPLSFMRDGDDCIIVASNNGGPRNPAWWLNLRADANALVQVGREQWEVESRKADEGEYERLWPLLIAYNPPYAAYKEKAEREIPVVILKRRAGGND